MSGVPKTPGCNSIRGFLRVKLVLHRTRRGGYQPPAGQRRFTEDLRASQLPEHLSVIGLRRCHLPSRGGLVPLAWHGSMRTSTPTVCTAILHRTRRGGYQPPAGQRRFTEDLRASQLPEHLSVIGLRRCHLPSRGGLVPLARHGSMRALTPTAHLEASTGGRLPPLLACQGLGGAELELLLPLVDARLELGRVQLVLRRPLLHVQEL